MISMFLTSKKRTTSKIRTEAVSPKCPLFGGSTVLRVCACVCACVSVCMLCV